MREKLLWSAVAFLGLMLILAQAQTPTRPESQVGRYQIAIVPPIAEEGSQVFRLDTVTGKTWTRVVETGSNKILFTVVTDFSPKDQR